MMPPRIGSTDRRWERAWRWGEGGMKEINHHRSTEYQSTEYPDSRDGSPECTARPSLGTRYSVSSTVVSLRVAIPRCLQGASRPGLGTRYSSTRVLAVAVYF